MSSLKIGLRYDRLTGERDPSATRATTVGEFEVLRAVAAVRAAQLKMFIQRIVVSGDIGIQ